MENIKMKKMKSLRFYMINDMFHVSTKEMIFFSFRIGNNNDENV